MELLPLVDILKVFNNPISEEQAWAVCYQCSRFLSDNPLQEHYQNIVDSRIHSIWLSRKGEILLRRTEAKLGNGVEHHTRADPGACTRTQPTQLQPRVIATESHAVQALGMVIYETLDYGIDASEERQLSHELESLIAAMTQSESACAAELDPPSAADDEGIVGDADVGRGCDFQDVIKMCSQHVTSSQYEEHHYRAVCRALATEAGELFTFLDRIAATKEKLSDDTDADAKRLEEFQRADWVCSAAVHACMWVQVMRSLRQGVYLKKVEHVNLPPVEYELTPFEMLMEDIRSRRYTLHKIMVNGDIPVRVQNNAHDVILEFIRTRPPLRKVDDRKLKKTRSKSPDLHELLLREIRSKPKLRPTRNGKLLVGTPRFEINMDSDQGPQSPARQLIKPDFSLLFQNSLEESSGDEESLRSGSLTSSPVLQTSFPSLTVAPPSPPWHRAGAFLLEDKAQSPPRLQRRHTITVCGAGGGGKKHVRSCIEYLSLTLEELTHIRSVFTKAELESLAWQPELYQQVSKSKLCFTCRRTKFTLFGEWGTRCKICQRTVCSKCLRKMNVPTDHFRNIPVYSLSSSLLTNEIRDIVKKTTRTAPAPSVPQTRASSPTRNQEQTHKLRRQHKLRRPDSAEFLFEDNSKDTSTILKHAQSIQSVKKSESRKGALLKQSLKGPLMAICCECSEMVTEIVRSSRTSLAAMSSMNSPLQTSSSDRYHGRTITGN